MITYYVSGDEDIEPSSESLRESGRLVLHGPEIEREAVAALPQGGSFVVVAHGDEAGTVFYRSSIKEPQQPWLWVGMEPCPSKTRLYLYCCCAGPRLSEFLGECECFGHAGVVPMPVEQDASLVLEFLDAVDELMAQEEFARDSWRARLKGFVAERLQMALQNDTQTSYRPVCVWAMLARSL